MPFSPPVSLACSKSQRPSCALSLALCLRRCSSILNSRKAHKIHTTSTHKWLLPMRPPPSTKLTNRCCTLPAQVLPIVLCILETPSCSTIARACRRLTSSAGASLFSPPVTVHPSKRGQKHVLSDRHPWCRVNEELWNMMKATRAKLSAATTFSLVLTLSVLI